MNIIVNEKNAQAGMDCLFDAISNGEPSTLTVTDNVYSKALAIVESVDYTNPANTDADTWSLYFGSDPQDIALDFIMCGIKTREAAEDFIRKTGATAIPEIDRICRNMEYLLEHWNDTTEPQQMHYRFD